MRREGRRVDLLCIQNPCLGRGSREVGRTEVGKQHRMTEHPPTSPGPDISSPPSAELEKEHMGQLGPDFHSHNSCPNKALGLLP